MNRRSHADEPDGLVWFRSSYSDTSNPNDCVEIAGTAGTVHIRDSKNVAGPRLSVAAESWAGFVAYASGR
ncbi:MULTISPECIES: DUF397 domain-containing protein [Streptomyces]|jgi:Domain of unknown function (DUF397).|uniref:DUF397 domain-containing protein n=2 Tax=Streptomyces TaxID=1883 RepID=A0A1D8G5J4_9ACTN|nr:MULTISPECIES: DUF397 domain-containing protein [Streptomyces]AOT60722.1 hypothetical protein A4G23_03597 [Streptomyces rubrolavendulae]KAF0649520.1 hypothetical protein K701_13105 [Streptomyces fradiae ATCC 10745 = DSM 40063]OSY48883.1 hypothetical protein BG846_05528 [Streptomyces fradiae ATCC 10745 = DSM 40063]QEV13810.1 DUF397 domain-containing protein [Streptomyces fradiae ATCC 10745 = DSM 40063]